MDWQSQADMLCFLDIDMAILASDETTYDQYAENVRKEYGHYSDALYQEGRINVLQNFLKRERVFLSDIFKGSGMEEKARANISREIASLKQWSI
jgi:predicted metal-dependent HD superfamily phosphohydrolase